MPITYGTDNYSRSAECTVVTWALDDGPVECWDRFADPNIPPALQAIFYDPTISLTAHNAPFDWRIIERALKIPLPITRWRCTQAKAYAHGLPGKLEVLDAILELPFDDRKLQDGKKLIQLFCVPHVVGWNTPQTHPTEWARFIEYAKQDTHTLRLIDRKLPSHNYQGEHLELWWIDQLINERGFQFDAELAGAARQLLDKAKNRHGAEMTEATDGSVTAPTQRQRLLDWLQSSGLALPNLKAATIREWLEHDDLRPEHRFILELRREGAKSSGSKYRRGMETVGVDGRIRNTIQYSGAGRTGRFAGRGYQPHNMARPTTLIKDEHGRSKRIPVKAKYIEDVIIPGILSGAALDHPFVYGGPNEACVNALRGAIVAAPGNELVVADWSNIESRVLAWLAGEDWKLAAYRAVDCGEGVDLYKLLFHQFFGTSVDQIDDQQRQSGKVSELAFGFGGGVGALVTMAATYEMELDPIADMVLPVAKPQNLNKAYKAWRRALLAAEDYGLQPRTYQACDVLKQVYRESNEAINKLRNHLDSATKDALRLPNRLFHCAKCKIWSTGSWLVIQLPSGRRLLYSTPRLHTERIVDADTGRENVYEYVSYLTARGPTWRRERAWSGLFVENIVQAVANDILRAALRLIHRESRKIPAIAAYLATLPEKERTVISLHVHDEIATEQPKGLLSLQQLITWMTTDLQAANPWMAGIPLVAAGWVGTRFGKKG